MLGAILLFASCKKESDIGSEIQNDPVNLSVSDTTTLRTWTAKEDSVRTDEPFTHVVQIGEMTDRAFGKTQAGLFMQVFIRNGQEQINFGTGSVLDSAVLCLAYDYDYYGDTTTQQTFNVYQVTEKMYKDSAYYSNRQLQYYPTPIGTKVFSPTPRSATTVGTDTTRPQLRITLDPFFAQQLFGQSGGPVFANNSTFIDYMRGFYVTSESNLAAGTDAGALVRFNMLDTLTCFRLYYHEASNTAQTFSFEVSSATPYFNHFSHDYSPAFTPQSTINQQLTNPGPYYNEVYVQGAAGLKTKIEFPFLNDWKNLGYTIAVNKAELVIKADASLATANFPVNKQLRVIYLDSVGTAYFLPDEFDNSTYFGGALNSTTSEYHINIALYFQRLLAGDIQNYGLYLVESNPYQEARRAVLGSALPAAGNLKMYLHLVYTRVN